MVSRVESRGEAEAGVHPHSLLTNPGLVTIQQNSEKIGKKGEAKKPPIRRAQSEVGAEETQCGVVTQSGNIGGFR